MLEDMLSFLGVFLWVLWFAIMSVLTVAILSIIFIVLYISDIVSGWREENDTSRNES